MLSIFSSIHSPEAAVTAELASLSHIASLKFASSQYPPSAPSRQMLTLLGKVHGVGIQRAYLSSC